MIKRRKATLVLACCLCMASASCWYTKQGGRYLSERAGAKSTAKLSADHDTDQRLRDFLALVNDIRSFGTERVGLTPTKNYTSYVTLDQDYVADVVSACASDAFSRHYWKYPLLGNLPYRGFYDREDAEEEARRLKEAGLDVIIRKVDAFSSLGFFRDPLYSFMLDYDEDVLAEIILHESAHATLFVKGQDQFNEEFATFVGRVAAEAFLEDRYGPGSPQLRRRLERSADARLFADYLKQTASLLDAVYSREDLSREEKLAEKELVIQERAGRFKEVAPDLFSNQAYSGFDMAGINNAYLDLYRLYEEDLSLYRRWFEEKSAGSLTEFVASMVDCARRARSAKLTVKELLAKELGEAALSSP